MPLLRVWSVGFSVFSIDLRYSHKLRRVRLGQRDCVIERTGIRHDERHANVQVFSDTFENKRAFADWAMAGLPGDNPGSACDHLTVLRRSAPQSLRAALAGS